MVPAVADQQAGGPLGFLNPAIYSLAKSWSPAIFDSLPTGLQD
jgi:hypothetical protein